jgi:hypothetical protein
MNKYLGSSRRHSVKRIISSSMWVCLYVYVYRHWPCSVLSHFSFIIIHPVYLSRRIERKKKEGPRVKQIFFLLLSFSHWTISARIHLTHSVFISLTSKNKKIYINKYQLPISIFISSKIEHWVVIVNIIWSMLSSKVLMQRCFYFVLTN